MPSSHILPSYCIVPHLVEAVFTLRLHGVTGCHHYVAIRAVLVVWHGVVLNLCLQELVVVYLEILGNVEENQFGPCCGSVLGVDEDVV